jgi:nitrite reductase/ring-hydroxylating ferredoxin subunit
VTCPLHESVFALRDGALVHGPAAYPQPAWDARARAGRVEVRRR